MTRARETDGTLIVTRYYKNIMGGLADEDAAVIEVLQHEFETMGNFSPEGPNSSVAADPTDVLGPDGDGERRDSIFYTPIHGDFMDWGFRLSCQFRDPFPQEAAHVVPEFTPYAQLVVERLLQTWVEVDFNNYHPRADIWISGSVTDAADAQQARETYAELYGDQPPDNYYGSLLDADEPVIQFTMKTHPDKYESADDFRQRCRDREDALYHIDYTEPEITQLY